MMQYLTGGADLTAIALFINRIALGAFFTVSGFHKLFNRQRHAVFVRELLVICLVAVHTSGKRRVISSMPIDRADYLDDVLYLPEVLYLVMLVVVVLGGPGPLRLDSIVLGAL